MSITQRNGERLDYPRCPVCGLRIPPAAQSRSAERGCCDICARMGMDPAHRDRWIEAQVGGTDAVSFEHHGPHEPERLPRMDTVSVEVEYERNPITSSPNQLERFRFVQRVRAKRKPT